MPRFLGTLALIALAPTLAAAQTTPGSEVCKDGPMPFEATAANRLIGAQLQQAVTGKKLGYLLESIRTPGAWVNNAREHRRDGSMLYTCEYAFSQSGPWRPCGSIGSVEKRVAGARDIGVWSIKNNALFSAKAAFGQNTKDCFAIHRQGQTHVAKRVSGPLAVCMQGAITLQ